MKGIDPANILSYGVVGLGFLLAFLAYRLLGVEQSKKSPQPATIKAIYVFMAFSLSLTGFGLASEVVRHKFSTPDASVLKAQYDDDQKKRFAHILNYLNRPLLESVKACKNEGEAAFNNKSDPVGCWNAGRRAQNAGSAAEKQLEDLRSQIQSAVGLAADAKP